MDLLLLDLVIVLAAARLFGAAAKRLGQPPVIGEIVAGILLGPTLLGPLIGDRLFGPEMRPPLQALANVGLVLFMFVVGLELDQKLVRGKGRIAVTVALGSTVVPFVLGCVLAVAIAGEHVRGDGGSGTLPFVLFMGAAMSATAFPVLARILTDRGMQRITLGGLSLATAAVIDVFAWTVLAVVVGIAGAGDAEGQWKVLLALPYALLMFLVVRPLLARLVPAYDRTGRLTPSLLSLVLIGLIGSAWATEWMHVHFIFGAFVFGTVMPREGTERRADAVSGVSREGRAGRGANEEASATNVPERRADAVSGVSREGRAGRGANEEASATNVPERRADAVSGVSREGRAGRGANEEASATNVAARLNHEILERLEQLAVLLLLPMFFVVAGLNVNLRELDLSSLGTLAAILAVAIGGKMLGSYAAARMQRLPNRQSWALATLLNTRGLTEIVILTVGLQKGVLDDELYSLMVVMALVTTAMTGPLLRKVYPDRRVARDIAEAERSALGKTAAYRVLVVVPEPLTEQTPLTDLAATLAGVKSPSEVVLAHLRPYPQGRLEVGTGLSSELTELAETLHDLETLAGTVRARGPEAQVVSRFSADVATELPELVSGAEPDLVVLPAGVPGYVGIRAGAVCRVVTVAANVSAETRPEAATGPVAVHHGHGGDAAAHVALMLALLRDRPLIVTGGGRASALAQRLARLGVAATSGAIPDGALVVAPDTGAAHDGAHLLVRAEQDTDPVDWAAAVSALRVAVPPMDGTA